MWNHKRLLWQFYLGAFLCISSLGLNWARSETNLCVLIFERELHPNSVTITETFLGVEDAIVVNEAVPADFYRCLKENPREIIIFSHTLYSEDASEVIGLSYFKAMSHEGRERSLEDWKAQLKEQIRRESASSKGRVCVGPRRKICRPKKSGLLELKKWERTLNTLPIDQKLYYPPIRFLPKVFKDAKKYLNRQKGKGQEVRLSRIRLISCDPQAVLNEYPNFRELIEENDIILDEAPKHDLMSWIMGIRVAQLDPRWLEESAQATDYAPRDGGAEGTPSWFSVYLKLNTRGVIRSGETVALRGKYRVSVQGVALGVSSKWSTIHIKYKDVEDLRVGEEKQIFIAHVDTSVALWLNLEVGLAPRPKFLGTSEVNSLGVVALGLFSWVSVQRLY